MPTKESTVITHCSFCRRSIDVVGHMIAGPPPNEFFPQPQSSICDLCIMVCFDELPELEAKEQRKQARLKRGRILDKVQALMEMETSDLEC